MQVYTERGIIWVEATYQSKERAEMDGYTYAFHSNLARMSIPNVLTTED